MTPTELRDQAYSEILADFTTGSREVNPVAGLAFARIGLRNLQNAALGGQCEALSPQQRDNLIGAYMSMLKNIGATLQGTRPYPAIDGWCRGPVGMILFWADAQSFDPAVVSDVVALGSSFYHVVVDVELIHEMIARHSETPGVLSFIEKAIQDHHNAQPLSN